MTVVAAMAAVKSETRAADRNRRSRRFRALVSRLLIAVFPLVFLPVVFLSISVLLPMFALAQANPAGFDDLVLRATAAREQNDVQQAIELYGQAVQLKPDWPDGWWFLGSLQYASDSYAAARDALSHFIALTPEGGPAFALRGLCEFETGEYTQSPLPRSAVADARR
jgi:cytochrome c-type biogenesis protein CcmH/NrfG